MKGWGVGDHTNNTSESVCERLRGSCNCFSSSPALKYTEGEAVMRYFQEKNTSRRELPTIRLRLVEEQGAGSRVV